MADDKRNPGRPDRDRIDVNEDYELRDWSEKFGVSKEELAAAVKRVRSSPANLNNAISGNSGHNAGP